MANLTLLDPFLTLIDYPSTLIASLRSGHSTCTRFSPCGSFLASGRVDGCVVVYDVETMGEHSRLIFTLIRHQFHIYVSSNF